MKRSSLIFILSAFTLFTACSPRGPYAVTNKYYQHESDSVLSVLKTEQPVALADSAGAPIPSSWVGTVNLNARKPNYVIIHFTAQDSAAQTLKTFTVVNTQV